VSFSLALLSLVGIFRKLSLPEGALQKLFDWPDNWVSVVPRALLPPGFLQNSYQDLAKQLRSISLMSLGIVGINCVSSHYRDTEVDAFSHAIILFEF
jgi:hypothetical protein